jgi:hypothetical protein
VLFVYFYFYLLADARWMEVCVGVGAAAFTVYVYKQTVELLGVIFCSGSFCAFDVDVRLRGSVLQKLKTFFSFFYSS